MKAMPRDRYVQTILDLYRATPGTRGRIRPADRCLAQKLHQQDISVPLVRAALLLAAARRTFRDLDALPLQTIASLHYFLPVLREIQDQPLDPHYLDYLEARLAEVKTAYTGDHHRST